MLSSSSRWKFQAVSYHQHPQGNVHIQSPSLWSSFGTCNISKDYRSVSARISPCGCLSWWYTGHWGDGWRALANPGCCAHSATRCWSVHKRNKCEFLQKEVRYLGHLVDAHGFTPPKRQSASIDVGSVANQCHWIKSLLGVTWITITSFDPICSVS